MQYKTTKADGTLVTDWSNITGASYQTFRVLGETEAEKISADNRNDTGRSLEDTYYLYTVADRVKQTTSDGKNMSDIISKGTGSSVTTQWLASRCVDCDSFSARFNVGIVHYRACGYDLFQSSGSSGLCDGVVRPVVSLESNIQLSGNSNDGWTIN